MIRSIYFPLNNKFTAPYLLQGCVDSVIVNDLERGMSETNLDSKIAFIFEQIPFGKVSLQIPAMD